MVLHMKEIGNKIYHMDLVNIKCQMELTIRANFQEVLNLEKANSILTRECTREIF